MMAVLFERYMDKILKNGYWWQLFFNLVCNAGASFLLWNILQSELSEIDAMNNAE